MIGLESKLTQPQPNQPAFGLVWFDLVLVLVVQNAHEKGGAHLPQNLVLLVDAFDLSDLTEACWGGRSDSD